MDSVFDVWNWDIRLYFLFQSEQRIRSRNTLSETFVLLEEEYALISCVESNVSCTAPV
jgi:hypothetical protein